MSDSHLPRSQRQHLGEALIVYVYRALNKPKTNSYFHVRLLDVLLKCAKEPLSLTHGIHWANGTSCIKHFTSRSILDDHPDAPRWAATQVFAKGETFAFLSKEAIDRIRSMSREKRRQLEAIAAELFPDHESIKGDAQLYAGARTPSAEESHFTTEEERHVDRQSCGRSLPASLDRLQKLELSLNEVFADPDISSDEADGLRDELEDLLIGRLELEQQQINVELLARIMTRCLTRLGERVASATVSDLAKQAAALLATVFPILGAAGTAA